MAKWIYERWTIKWDFSEFPTPKNNSIALRARINIQTLEVESVVPEVGDIAIYETFINAYNQGRALSFFRVLEMSTIYVVKHSSLSNTKSWLATQRIKNTLQGTVIAEDGTYPDNGIHTDGYWYVKIKKVFPVMRILRDGKWVEVDTGYVLKDGVWKPIEEIYKLQDGKWVQA